MATSTRSWLFAPGDSEKKMEKATAGSADIAIFDLEDAVAPEEKPAMAQRRTEPGLLDSPFQKFDS